MDRQHQSQPQPQSQPRDYLKPPQQQQHRAPSAAAPSIPRAPVTAHPTATIADTTTFQGKYSIAIGAGTVIHPRAKIYSFEGPVVIGQGCIICEKAVIGTAPTPTTPATPATPTTPNSPSSPSSLSPSSLSPDQGTQTRISHNAVISPLATVHSGVTVHSAATVDCLATVHAHADIGAHSKICASCVVSPRAVIKEWVVVWGAGAGLGQRRRKRAVDGVTFPGAGAGAGPGLQGEIVEDARLVVLAKERETLVRLIGPAAGAGARRR